MKPKTHLAIGVVAASVLAPFWGIVKSIFLFLISGGIDIDHILDFLRRSKTKTRNIKEIIKKTYAFDEALDALLDRKNTVVFFLFHSMEFLLSIIVLSIIFYLLKSNLCFSFTIGIFFGALIHIGMDVIRNCHKKLSQSYSLIHFLIKRKMLKRKEINPDKVFDDILNSIEKK